MVNIDETNSDISVLKEEPERPVNGAHREQVAQKYNSVRDMADTLNPGEVLHPDQSIWSANGRFRFIYQTDGNLVLYGPGGPLWDSQTAGRTPGVCVMQGDGNLVIYGPGAVYIWDTKTHNNPGSRLIVQNDGNVVIYRPDGQVPWHTHTGIPQHPSAQGDDMQPDEALYADDSIWSANGRFRFIYQTDGNLVLYGPGGPLWDSQTAGRTPGVCVMQGDGNLVIYGPGAVYIWDTKTHNNPGSRLIVQNDGNVVIYRPHGVPIWDTDTVQYSSAQVANFKPSTSGFKFQNSWPSMPLLHIEVNGIRIPIGDASNGLCGGMAYAARDYHEAGIEIPQLTATPPEDSDLYRFLVDRLFHSFNLPSGPLRYLLYMNPSLPDHETAASMAGLAPRGRAWVMIRDEWPKIKSDIDSGILSPMGLVTVKSADPFELGKNHQVLAYKYELDGNNLTIFVYDPNRAMNDNVKISLDISRPEHTTIVTHNVNIGTRPIICFFRPDYSFVAPPTQ